tara:strand:+ start:99 stop:464 length:366 start_codon:yes stop_codon:yes gene_type:complete
MSTNDIQSPSNLGQGANIALAYHYNSNSVQWEPQQAQDTVTRPSGFNGYEEVSPSDEATLSTVAAALYVGTAGDISVLLAGTSENVLFQGVSGGAVLPIGNIERVNSTATTATNMIALSYV